MQRRILSSDDDELSPQQKKMLRRFAKGKSDEQIAREFGCRADLIAAQRQRIVEKLEIRSQEQLAAAARQFACWKRDQADAQK
jgi:DNA-binding CsgD family transcriptional regulator